MKNCFFCILKVTEDFGTDPHPEPSVRGTDRRIRIRIRTTSTFFNNTLNAARRIKWY
jgi:hypothetical protein